MTRALVIVALLAAAAQPQTPVDVKTTMKTIDSAQMSGVESPRQAIARTQAEWDALWRQHARAGRAAPAVDFASRMVAAVFLGSRNTGGYAVSIVGTRVDGTALIVQWVESAPSPRDVTAQVLTSPAHLVELPRHAGDVRFEKIQGKP